MLAALVRRLSRPPDLVIGVERWPALFTHAALLELEELTGLDVLNGGLNLLNPRARDLRDALYVLLKHAGGEYPKSEVPKLCGLSRIPALKATVIAAWRASTPDPEAPAEEPEDAKSPRKQTWLEAWAIARRRLGLSPAEWLAMTPRITHALLADYMEELRQGELMQSKIAAAVVNFGGMGRRGDLIEDAAFMIHPWPKQQASSGEVTGEELMKIFAPLRAEQRKRK